MPPDKLVLQTYEPCGQLWKECFEIFSILMERKNTINCIYVVLQDIQQSNTGY